MPVIKTNVLKGRTFCRLTWTLINSEIYKGFIKSHPMFTVRRSNGVWWIDSDEFVMKPYNRGPFKNSKAAFFRANWLFKLHFLRITNRRD